MPDRIELLGSPLQPRLGNPCFADFAKSLCPPVRELRPGERPSDWVSDTVESEASEGTAVEVDPHKGTAPARELAAAEDTVEVAAPEGTAPARELPPLEEPQLYQMQFTTTEEHAALVEKAKALLSHASPNVTLGELHLRALRLLVETLEKKRFGAKRSTSGADPMTQPERTSPAPAPAPAHAASARASEKPAPAR